MTHLLEASGVSVQYGTVRALENVSFLVDAGEIVAMIGPNGAGKSTALKAVCGLVQMKSGQIKYKDFILNGMTTDKLVARGLCLVPEGRRIFASMTVKENLEMGAFIRKDKKEIVADIENIFQLFPALKEKMKEKAGNLSTGEQQMLAIGRALMMRPTLLLLDEPSIGLSPNYVQLVSDKLVEINRNGVSILLVEQNARMALEICHRAYVFETGAIAFSGRRDELLNDERVKKAFLGG